MPRHSRRRGAVYGYPGGFALVLIVMSGLLLAGKAQGLSLYCNPYYTKAHSISLVQDPAIGANGVVGTTTLPPGYPGTGYCDCIGEGEEIITHCSSEFVWDLYSEKELPQQNLKFSADPYSVTFRKINDGPITLPYPSGPVLLGYVTVKVYGTAWWCVQPPTPGYPCLNGDGNYYYGTAESDPAQIAITVVYSPPATCTTPAIPTQEIPAVYVNDFKANGLTDWGMKTFDLQFINCSDLTKIRYKVDAVGTSPNPSLGLLPSTPNTGVAVQVLHMPTGYTPFVVTLDQWYERITSASSWSVPITVRYYKVGNVIPGPVNAKMTITTEYQ